MSEEFEAWLKQQHAELEAMTARVEALATGQPTKPKPEPKPEPEPEPEQLTAEEIAERARRLTDLGISYQAAKIYADPVKLAAMERQQRRRDLATRLGVVPQYLPEGAEVES